MRTGCLEENLQFPRGQLVRKRLQRIKERFPARNNNTSGTTCNNPLNNNLDIGRRKEPGIPRILGITPRTPDITPAQTDEISGFPCMKSLALKGVKILDKRQQPAPVECSNIDLQCHYSVTT